MVGVGFAALGADPPVIALVTGLFSVRSETFIFRVARVLRERGWRVQVVSQVPSHDLGREEFEDLAVGLAALATRLSSESAIHSLGEVGSAQVRSLLGSAIFPSCRAG